MTIQHYYGETVIFLTSEPVGAKSQHKPAENDNNQCWTFMMTFH